MLLFALLMLMLLINKLEISLIQDFKEAIWELNAKSWQGERRSRGWMRLLAPEKRHSCW